MVWGVLWAQPRAPEKSFSTIELTGDERAWIAAHPEVTVGHDPTYMPYAFYDQKHVLVGLDIDYLQLIAERTGLKIKNIHRSDWSATFAAFKAGEIDVVASIGYSEDREEFLIFGASYGIAPNVIVTRVDTPFVFDVRDLAGRKVAMPTGYGGLRSQLLREAPGTMIIEYPDVPACLEAVASGEVAATVSDVVNASYAVKTLRLANLRMGSVIKGNTELYMGVHRRNPVLAGIIEKAIRSITPAERQAINNRWIAVEYATDQKWIFVAKLAGGIALLAVLVFLLLFLHNRRLEVELEQRRRIQGELEVIRDRLGRVNDEKSELLRMVAHDLRNPLTGILLGTDLLKMMDPEEGKKIYDDTLDQIRTTTAQMIKLTNDLVDVNVLEDGKRPYVSLAVDFGNLLHEAASACSEAAARKLIRLSVNVDPSLPVIRSDAMALRQVCDNLISNALKYSPLNSGVGLELRRQEGNVQLRVQDQGPGISRAEQDQLFQKFVQGAAKPTGGEKSTGLGLWIVQRIVTDLNGRVWCESELGQGATFVVELPIAPSTG